MLAWLSVWSEVQTCIWPSCCQCHSLSLASVKSRLALPFWYGITQVVPDKGPLNGCVCIVSAVALMDNSPSLSLHFSQINISLCVTDRWGRWSFWMWGLCPAWSVASSCCRRGRMLAQNSAGTRHSYALSPHHDRRNCHCPRLLLTSTEACYRTESRLRYEPWPYCSWVQHTDHSATDK